MTRAERRDRHSAICDTPSARTRILHLPQNRQNKSIGDSSKKLDLRPFDKIVVSVGNDTPSARTTFLQLSAPRTAKIKRSFGDYSGLREACHCRFARLIWGLAPMQLQPLGTTQLSSSSLEVVTFEPGICQARAWNLSSSRLEPVKFDRLRPRRVQLESKTPRAL